jgi:hypothetical protein
MAVALPRIPFAEAISDPLLLRTGWGTFSPAQQAALKMFYGLPLQDDELAIWHALHGGGTFDALGYLVAVEDSGVAYRPGTEFEDITLIIGRRAAKSCLSSFVISYEALLGGHKARLQNTRQQPVFLQVAQDLATAKANLRQYILHYLESSPVGKETLGNVKETVTADSIRLMDCGLITVGPPNIKLRGQSVAVCAMDEVGFWAKDRESAAPDYEVEAAVRPSMIQFPNRKLLKTSTPWTKEGLLWTAATTGTYGRLLADDAKRAASTSVLVLKGPSAALENPTLSRKYLAQERAKDGDAFRREYLAEFADAVSGFLPVSLLHRAVSPGLRQRSPIPGVAYVGTIDPAFRRDAFAMCIGHMEADGTWVQDYVGSWQGTPDQPLSPSVALGMIGKLAKTYGLTSVVSDQYHVESLQELAMTEGFMIEPHILGWKNKQQMWQEFLTLLNQDKVRLLDHADLLQELRGIEKVLSPNGTVKISGKRDDLALATTLCLMRAVQFGVRRQPTTLRTDEPDAAAVAAFALDRLRQGMRRKPATAPWYAA